MIASLVMAVYIILRFGVNLTSTDREFYSKYGFNLNTIGLTCSVAGIFAYYFYKNHNTKHTKIYKNILIFSLFMIIITGSKKALFLPLIVFSVYCFFKASKYKRIIVSISLLLGIGIGYYAIIEIPLLYEIIGNRIEGMVNGLTGTGKVDSSTMARLQFIEYGLSIIGKKLWFGFGLASFTELHAYARPDEYASYSHNNFIELIVSGGIVGIVIYYSIYFILIAKFYHYILKYNDQLSLICFSLLIGLLFIHYGMVAYYDWFVNILVTLIAAYAFQLKSLKKAKIIH